MPITSYTFYADSLSMSDCEGVKTMVRKPKKLWAGFVSRIGYERLPKRTVFGQVKVGKDYRITRKKIPAP